MRIIPVIDLKEGQVVRGVGGRRDEYRPIQSQLITSAEPGAIASVLKRHFGLPQIYVADLDAITLGKFDVNSWQAIAEAGVSLMLDAGIRTAADARNVWQQLNHASRVSQFVIGLESLTSFRELVSIAAIADNAIDRAVFSLDLKQGQLLTRDPDWQPASPLEIVAEVYRYGIRSLIVLDLADVGSGQGISTLPLVGAIREAFLDLEIIAGGGVRSVMDLRALQAAGGSAALVASALHDGRLTRECLASI